MQRIFCVLFLWGFLLTTASAQNMPAGEPTRILGNSATEKPTIAITTFENLSAFPENTWVAMSFSEALTTKVKRLYERFRLVERLRVYEVIREQGIDPEKVDSLEPTTQRDIGSFIDANYLILGSVSLQGVADDPQTKLLANMRTVDVRTGEIKEAASISGQMQEIFDLEIQLAFAFLKQVGVDITAAEEQQISIKETESLLAEKYYNLGNKAYYEADYSAAEAWYQKAVAITEGGYHREAALRWIEALKRQQTVAQATQDETTIEAIREKAGQRIKTIEQQQAGAAEMNFEKAELFMIRGEYEPAIAAYQSYLAKAERLLKWETDTRESWDDAIVVDGELFLFNDRRLTMLDIRTGKILWKFESKDPFSEEQGKAFPLVYATPVVTDGMVYWWSRGALYALKEADGSVQWEFVDDAKALSNWMKQSESDGVYRMLYWDAPPVVTDDLVYRRSAGGVLYALDKNTGVQRWKFDAGVSRDVSRSRFAYPAESGLPLLVVQSGILYTQSGRGIAALKADSGEMVWHRELPSTPGWLGIIFEKPSESRTAKLTRVLGFRRGLVIREFAPYANITTFLSQGEKALVSGDRVVEMAGVLVNTPADLVRVTSAVKPNDQISIKVVRGGRTFETELRVPYQVVILPTMQGNLLYAFVNDTLSALDADTGEIQWSFSDSIGMGQRQFPDSAAIRRALISDGVLYCVVNVIESKDPGGGGSWPREGQLYALDSQTGEIRWQRQQPLHKTPLEDFIRWQSVGPSPFDPDTGEPQPLPLKSDLQPFAVMEDRIVGRRGNGEGQVVFTNAKTGQQEWGFSLPASGRLLTDNETIYLVSENAIYAFNTEPESVTHLFENTPALVGLGRAYRLVGQYQKAIQPLQEAAKWRVDDLGAYRELAFLYEDMERWSLATYYWDKYLTAIPSGEEIPQEIKEHLFQFAGLRWWKKEDKINQLFVHDGLAYLIRYGKTLMTGEISGLSLQTGVSQWRAKPSNYESPFTIGNGMLFCYDGGWKSDKGVESRIKAISLESSETQWETTIRYRKNIRTFPKLRFQFDRDTLYVQSHTYDKTTFHWVSVLHALDGETGEVLWHYQQEGQDRDASFGIKVNGRDVWPYPTIGKFIYWKAGRGRLYALHRRTGKLMWKFERDREGVDLDAAPSYLLSPVLVGETLFADLGDTLYAFDAKTGAIRWQFPGHWTYKLVANREIVVLQTWEENLYALDSRTGEILWQKPDSSQHIALRDDVLYLFGSKSVKALSVETGQTQWTRELKTESSISFGVSIDDIHIHNQTAFLLTTRALVSERSTPKKVVLYAIDLTNGDNLWRLNLVDWGSPYHSITYVDENTLILSKEKWTHRLRSLYAIDLVQARQSKLALAAREVDDNQLEFLSSLRNEIMNRREELKALLPETHHPKFLEMIEILASYDEDFEDLFGVYLTGKQFKAMRTDIVPVLIALWKAERSPDDSSGERNRVIQRALFALGNASIVPDLKEIVTYNGYAGPVLAELQGDAAIPTLLNALQRYTVYYAEGVMRALATLKAKEAVPILSQRLVGAETMQQKETIAGYLREIGDASAIPALQEAFTQVWEQFAQEGAASASYEISQALGALGDKKGVEGLIQLLERVDSIPDISS